MKHEFASSSVLLKQTYAMYHTVNTFFKILIAEIMIIISENTVILNRKTTIMVNRKVELGTVYKSK